MVWMGNTLLTIRVGYQYRSKKMDTEITTLKYYKALDTVTLNNVFVLFCFVFISCPRDLPCPNHWFTCIFILMPTIVPIQGSQWCVFCLYHQSLFVAAEDLSLFFGGWFYIILWTYNKHARRSDELWVFIVSILEKVGYVKKRFEKGQEVANSMVYLPFPVSIFSCR